jgi:small subunit ribosomal protein S2
MQYATVKDFLEAGSHFGHKTNRWNPKMRPYIFGVRNGIHIIDLQQTVALFRKVLDFARDITARGDKILFVGTKRQAQDIVVEEATRGSQYYVSHRWLGGTLTNFVTIKKTIERLQGLEKMENDGTVENLKKREALRLHREKEKLERNLGGIREMTRLPGALFVVDPSRERIPVAEANRLGIPVIAITDTNCDPDLIEYVVPSNDDALKAIRLIVAQLADACLEGGRLHQERLVSRDREGAGRGAPREQAQRPADTGGVVEVIMRDSGRGAGPGGERAQA